MCGSRPNRRGAVCRTATGGTRPAAATGLPGGGAAGRGGRSLHTGTDREGTAVTTVHPPAPETPRLPTATRPRHVPDEPGGRAWRRLLATLAIVVAASDLAFFGLIAEVIPPLAVGVALTLVGLALLRRRPRAGIAVLGLSGLLMLVGNAPFAVDHLGHPASPIDFVHAVVGTLGRVLVIVAAVGAWREATAQGARRLAVVCVGLAAVVLLLTTVATIASSGEDVVAGDIEVLVEEAAFPDVVRVGAGDTVFVDNADVFRHTFTVEAIGLDLDLPAMQGARAVVDAPPGSYAVTCEVPGHDFMTGTLEVG
jgi:plastocyanin